MTEPDEDRTGEPVSLPEPTLAGLIVLTAGGQVCDGDACLVPPPADEASPRG